MWCQKVGVSEFGSSSSDFVVFMCFEVGKQEQHRRDKDDEIHLHKALDLHLFCILLGDGLAQTSILVQIHVCIKACWEQFEALY